MYRAGAGAAGELPLPPASVGDTFPPGLTWPQEAMLTTITENTINTPDAIAEGLPDPGAAPEPDQDHNTGLRMFTSTGVVYGVSE